MALHPLTFLMKYRDLERFWGRVDKTDQCWLWKGYLRGNGYGGFSYKGREWQAHRIVWELVKGAIPNGLCVLHKCDVPKCVNPDHLFLGTHSENMRDAYQKGRVRPPPSKKGRHWKWKVSGPTWKQLQRSHKMS